MFQPYRTKTNEQYIQHCTEYYYFISFSRVGTVRIVMGVQHFGIEWNGWNGLTSF